MTTRLEISGSNYPLAVNIPIYIDYVLADIREPDKRNSSFSKTIQLYGTNEVNILFENIFDVNISLNVFNPNKKVDAKYFANSLLIFEGSLQLLSVTLKPDGLIVYDCCIIGNENGIFLELGDKLISELDFSAYDHVYSRANIVSSWSNTSGTGYNYPFVDNGTSVSEDEFKVENFMPCFFAYEYIKKIFESKGYTYTSTFLDSTFFKKLIVYPNYNGVKLSQEQIDNSQFYVGLNALQAKTINSGTFSFVTWNNETGIFNDAGNLVIGDTITFNNNGNYNIVFKPTFQYSFTHTDPTVNYAIFSIDIVTEMEFSNNGGATWSTLNSRTFLEVNNSALPSVTYNVAEDMRTPSFGLNIEIGDLVKCKIATVNTSNVTYYNALNIPVVTGTGTIVSGFSSGNNGTSVYAELNDAIVTDGENIEANMALPTNIKQKDFLKSIMQMFNLYCDFDRTDKTKLIIETYSDFFTNDIVDWNNRTDLNKDIKINPIGLLDAKRYVFKYKDDKDFYNTQYKDKWLETYGSEFINVDNDFLKNDKVNEVIFSPSPTVQNNTMGANIVKIYKNQQTRASEIPNIRLLIANGVKQSINNWTFKSNGLSDLVSKDYGSALMENDSMNPTVSLQFGYPRELFYDYLATSFTTNILYNTYHKKQIDNITHKNSKIDVRYLWLKYTEINQFSFRKKYFIDNGYWIINKVVNYNPFNESSVKVELIKLL